MASELSGVTPQPLQQNTQNAQSPSANIGQNGVISKTPDSAVTQTASPEKTDVGKDEAHKQAGSDRIRRAGKPIVPRLENLSDSGVKTLVGFDLSENNQIFIKVQDSQTGVEIAEIPSKEFVQFLRQRFEELSGGNTSKIESVSETI